MPGNFVHVAVGVVKNNLSQVLLSKRLANVDHSGLWEFPGGKVKSGETAYEALSRELNEEVGLNVKSAQPLIKVYHDYKKYSVLLDVWQVGQWDSDFLANSSQYGQEGQLIKWVNTSQLGEYNFPEANNPVIRAIHLPEIYLICPAPEPFGYEDYLQKFQACITSGICLFQLRFGGDLQYDQHQVLVTELLRLAKSNHATVLVNASPECAANIGAHGVHLNSMELLRCNEDPTPRKEFIVSASCHNMSELQWACKINVDFTVLSPVKTTTSHPTQVPLGWDRFKEMIESLPIPVYALGGMEYEDLSTSRAFGAQGIAILSGVWGEQKELSIL